MKKIQVLLVAITLSIVYVACEKDPLVSPRETAKSNTTTAAASEEPQASSEAIAAATTMPDSTANGTTSIVTVGNTTTKTVEQTLADSSTQKFVNVIDNKGNVNSTITKGSETFTASGVVKENGSLHLIRDNNPDSVKSETIILKTDNTSITHTINVNGTAEQTNVNKDGSTINFATANGIKTTTVTNTDGKVMSQIDTVGSVNSTPTIIDSIIATLPIDTTDLPIDSIIDAFPIDSLINTLPIDSLIGITSIDSTNDPINLATKPVPTNASGQVTTITENADGSVTKTVKGYFCSDTWVTIINRDGSTITSITDPYENGPYLTAYGNLQTDGSIIATKEDDIRDDSYSFLLILQPDNSYLIEYKELDGDHDTYTETGMADGSSITEEHEDGPNGTRVLEWKEVINTDCSGTWTSYNEDMTVSSNGETQINSDGSKTETQYNDGILYSTEVTQIDGSSIRKNKDGITTSTTTFSVNGTKTETYYNSEGKVESIYETTAKDANGTYTETSTIYWDITNINKTITTYYSDGSSVSKDGQGNITSETTAKDANGTTVRTDYNSDGTINATSFDYSDGSYLQKDGLGRTTYEYSSTDANGTSTSTQYSYFNGTTEKSITTYYSDGSSITKDGSGKTTSSSTAYVNGGNTTTYYDSTGIVSHTTTNHENGSETIYADGRKEVQTYNSEGGGSFTSYDANGNIINSNSFRKKGNKRIANKPSETRSDFLSRFK